MSRTFLTLAASVLLVGSAFASDTAPTVDQAPVDPPAAEEPADSCDAYGSRGELARAKVQEGLRGRELTQAIHACANVTPADDEHRGGKMAMKQLRDRHEQREAATRDDR